MKIHGGPSSSLASLRPPLERPLRRLRAYSQYSEMSEITSSDEKGFFTLLCIEEHCDCLGLPRLWKKGGTKTESVLLALKIKKSQRILEKNSLFLERENLTQFKRSIRNVANSLASIRKLFFTIEIKFPPPPLFCDLKGN